MTDAERFLDGQPVTCRLMRRVGVDHDDYAQVASTSTAFRVIDQIASDPNATTPRHDTPLTQLANDPG